MEARVTLVTLGVADMTRARGFYERLGWRAHESSNPDVTFFDAGSLVVGLFGHAALAEDAGVAEGAAPAFRGVSLALNLRSTEAVDATMREAVAAGAVETKPAQPTFWGGYAGYFADPDGHLWEIAHNPFWPLDADGRVRLP
jgi:catechol 2,3-dioxygenase-like lactoylglutathione lyase family enzyme